MSTTGAAVQALNGEVLAPLARKASGREDMILDGWHVQPIVGGAEQASSIQKVFGVGRAGDQPVPWSMVLKTISIGPDNAAGPNASHFWRREVGYYGSGLLETLPAGLRGPRCYGIIEQEDACLLFLEELRDDFHDGTLNQGWPLVYYRRAARCLGRFNGAFLAGHPIPQADFIPQDWLGSYIEESAPNMAQFERLSNHPMVRRSFGVVPPGLIRQAWDLRGEILAALRKLPRVFCHNDVFHRNAFVEQVDGEDRLVVVDWSYAGPGALGTELAVLVCAGIWLGSQCYSDGDWIIGQALEGYLDGLAETGWRGSPDLVRFGFYASSFWRYALGAFIGEFLTVIVDESYYPFLEQVSGLTIEQIAESNAEWYSWILRFFDESLRLKQLLGF